MGTWSPQLLLQAAGRRCNCGTKKSGDPRIADPRYPRIAKGHGCKHVLGYRLWDPRTASAANPRSRAARIRGDSGHSHGPEQNGTRSRSGERAWVAPAGDPRIAGTRGPRIAKGHGEARSKRNASGLNHWHTQEQTSRRADKQTSRRADEQTSRQADEQTSRRADEQTSKQQTSRGVTDTGCHGRSHGCHGHWLSQPNPWLSGHGLSRP